MSSPKQIAANRRNALKSTGPMTEEGKNAHAVMLFDTALLPRPSSPRLKTLTITRLSKLP